MEVVLETDGQTNAKLSQYMQIVRCPKQSEDSDFVDAEESHHCNVVIHCSDGWDRTAQVSSAS